MTYFPLGKKRKLLIRAVTAYLLMIYWIFFNTIYQKKKEKRTQVDLILTV